MKKQSGRNDIVDTILKKIIGEEEFLEKRSEFMPDISRPRRSMDENISIAAQIEAERNEAIIAQREVNNVGPGLGPIFGPEVPVELPSESNEQASGEEYAQNREQMLQRRALASRQNDETYRRRFIKFVLWMHRQVEDIAFHLQRMVTAIDEGRIHDTCPHRKPCFEYWFNVGLPLRDCLSLEFFLTFNLCCRVFGLDLLLELVFSWLLKLYYLLNS